MNGFTTLPPSSGSHHHHSLQNGGHHSHTLRAAKSTLAAAEKKCSSSSSGSGGTASMDSCGSGSGSGGSGGSGPPSGSSCKSNSSSGSGAGPGSASCFSSSHNQRQNHHHQRSFSQATTVSFQHALLNHHLSSVVCGANIPFGQQQSTTTTTSDTLMDTAESGGDAAVQNGEPMSLSTAEMLIGADSGAAQKLESKNSDQLATDNSSSAANSNCGKSSAAAAPVIADLLKEFDVCFNSADHIDDDSSTLTDNSSVSSNYFSKAEIGSRSDSQLVHNMNIPIYPFLFLGMIYYWRFITVACSNTAFIAGKFVFAVLSMMMTCGNVHHHSH